LHLNIHLCGFLSLNFCNDPFVDQNLCTAERVQQRQLQHSSRKAVVRRRAASFASRAAETSPRRQRAAHHHRREEGSRAAQAIDNLANTGRGDSSRSTGTIRPRPLKFDLMLMGEFCLSGGERQNQESAENGCSRLDRFAELVL
jgi:hypothetical protein